MDGKESIFVHNIAVHTGDERGAGTNAKVWIEMFDEKREGSGKIQLRGGSFERDETDHFPVELTHLYSPIDHIYIGHDDGGVGAAWFLNCVVIGCPAAGLEQTFDCMDWIKQGRDSSAMVKLKENKTKRKKISSSEGWICQGKSTRTAVFSMIKDVMNGWFLSLFHKYLDRKCSHLAAFYTRADRPLT